MNVRNDKKTAVFCCPKCKQPNGLIELVPAKPISIIVDCSNQDRYFISGDGTGGTLKTKDIEIAVCKMCGNIGDVEKFLVMD